MPGEMKVYSLKEVEEHTDDKDVWIVIHDRVYNVTKFLDEVSWRATFKRGAVSRAVRAVGIVLYSG